MLTYTELLTEKIRGVNCYKFEVIALPPYTKSLYTRAMPKKAPAKKTPTKKAPAKKAPAKKAPAKKRKVNPALMKPIQPDDVLAKVIGSKPVPRGEMTKKLWDYIKKNKLQDTKNKRQINADDNLKAVFGGKKSVSMFEMTKLVSQHVK
jgi:upstream activation factor subunit UAF30